TKLRYFPHRLEDDSACHLRAAGASLGKDDRHLYDFDAGANREVGGFDLECVALRSDAVERKGLERLTAPALEPAREVADRDAEDRSRIEGAEAADRLPSPAPVLGAAAFDVAGAESEAGALRGTEEARQVSRVVREVR